MMPAPALPASYDALLKQAEFEFSIRYQGWLIAQIAWKAAMEPTEANRNALQRIVDRDEQN